MIVALGGSYGVGKTSVLEEIERQRPDISCIREAARYIPIELGYKGPHQMARELGVGVFQIANVAAWAILNRSFNPDLKPNVVIDSSPVESLAYFWALGSTEQDIKHTELVTKQIKYYASLVDHYIHFPLGVVPLQNESVRPGDNALQFQIEQNIHHAISVLGFLPSKVHHLESKSIADRAQEVLGIINSNQALIE